MYIGLHVKYLLSLSGSNETWTFATDFRKIRKCQISWKSVQWEQSCSMMTNGRTERHTDRQTDVTKLILAFSNYAKASKILHRLWLYQKNSSLDHYHLFPKLKQNIGSHRFKDDRHIEAAVTAMAGNTGHGLMSTDNSKTCSKCLKVKLTLYSPRQALTPGGRGS